MPITGQLLPGVKDPVIAVHNVANSCRFDGSSSYMSKTLGTPTSAKKGTISYWFKQGKVNTGTIKTAFSFGAEYGAINYDTGSTKGFEINLSNGNGWYKGTNTGFTARDPSAWWHLMVVVDTTQGTEANRFKFFMNGSQITFTSGNNFPSSNGDIPGWASGQVMQVGRRSTGDANYFDGNMAEVVFIDGSALTPSDFGEYDEDSGIWKPIDVSGLTFGNNGFYLDFQDASNLGNDANGGTDLTETGLDATNQSTDTCTNNFATLNSLINFNSGVFTEGNLAITSGDDTVSTIGLTSGRWYWEAQRTNTTNEAHIGIGVSKGFFSATSVVSSGDRIYVRGGATFVSAVSNLGILTFASNSGTPATISNGDVIGFYLDLESSTKNITVKKNDGATPIIDINLTYSGEEPIFPFCRMNSGCASSWNFGNPIEALSSANADANGFGSFEFNPTKGGVDYFAICTKNLAEFGG